MLLYDRDINTYGEQKSLIPVAIYDRRGWIVRRLALVIPARQHGVSDVSSHCPAVPGSRRVGIILGLSEEISLDLDSLTMISDRTMERVDRIAFLQRVMVPCYSRIFTCLLLLLHASQLFIKMDGKQCMLHLYSIIYLA